MATLVNITSTVDGASEPAMYDEPASPSGKPLVVSCHSWNGRYNSYDGYAATLDACIGRGWGFISPDFRGAASSPTWLDLHAGSATAIQDVLDARAWAIAQGGYDPDKVYICGGSGGGYMAMLVAAKNAGLFRAVGSVVGIADLGRWHEFCATRAAYMPETNLQVYSDSLEAIFGGPPQAPSETSTRNAYRDRSPITWLEGLLQMPVHLQAGIFDGTVQLEQTILFWNRLVSVKGYAGQMIDGWEAAEILRQSRNSVLIDSEISDTGNPAGSYLYATVMERIAGNCRLYVEAAGHTGDFNRMFATFDAVEAGTILPQAAKRAPVTPAAVGQLL